MYENPGGATAPLLPASDAHEGGNKIYRKIAKKDRKMALLSLYLLYLYHP